MADIYLTKKERTTLYTEGLIYSIVIVIAAYFTIYGGLFVKMIPMLFILGIIGRCIFDKPKTTLLLGSIAILLTGYMVQFKIDLNLILTTIYSGILIALGLKVGKLIRTLYKAHKLRAFIGYNRRTMINFSLIILTVVAIFLNSIVNSNPIQYIFAKNKTDKYIRQTYGDVKYKVESVSYNIKNKGGYTFNVNIDDKKVILVHRTLSSIEDTNLQERKDDVSRIENENLSIWKQNNNIDETILLNAIYNYSKVSLNPDLLEISIETSLEYRDINLREEKILNIIDCINKLSTFKDYGKITNIKLNIDNKSMSINKEKINEGITKEYIENGLEIEYLD